MGYIAEALNHITITYKVTVRNKRQDVALELPNQSPGVIAQLRSQVTLSVFLCRAQLTNPPLPSTLTDVQTADMGAHTYTALPSY